VDGSIWLWQILANAPNGPVTDSSGGNQNRIETIAETPAYDWQNQFQLKKLEGGELFLDQLFGKVDIQVEFRPDSNPCWYPWYQKTYTGPDVAPGIYPAAQACPGYVSPMVLPKPPMPKTAQQSHRTVDLGYYFQVRITVLGAARLRGFLFYASPRYQEPYGGLNR
jgi:hypothetical protein